RGIHRRAQIILSASLPIPYDRTPLRPTAGFRARRHLRDARRGPLVRLSRRPAARRDGPARGAFGRPARARASGLGSAAVAEKTRLAGRQRPPDDISL